MPTAATYEYADIISRLLAEMPLNEKQKSSHWAHYSKGFQLDNNFSLSGISGFGSNSPRTLVRGIYHRVFQKMLFSGIGNFSKSPNYKLAKEIVKYQNRSLDVDVLRHVFTFDLLNSYATEMDQSGAVCSIGDGMSNFVSMASASGKWSKIVSINLPEILINDLLMLSKLPWLAGNKVKLAQTSAELGAFLLDEDTKVVLVAANNAGIATSQSIGFFVNIASFQEMTVDIVGRYFEIVRSNSAYLYCCNRELKILPGGERLEFSRYPWGTASILLDEPCKWHQFFYAIRNFPKFKTPYDGPLRHRLAKFPEA